MMKWVFGADTTPFRKGLDEMRTQTKAFSGSVSKMLLGAFSVGAVVSGFKILITQMARINDLSARFGETAETMQVLSHSAVMAGTDLEAVARAMTIATKNSYAAAAGNKTMADSFAMMGINASEFVNLPMEQKVLALAKAMESGKGDGEKLALAMKILGKSGGDMIPLLSQGFEELNAQMEGTSVVSQSTVDSMAKLDDAFEALKQKATVVGAAIYDGLRMIGVPIGVVVATAVMTAITSLKTLAESALDAGAIVGNVLSGDFESAGKVAERFKNRVKDAFAETKANAKAAGAAISETYDDIYGAPKNKAGDKSGAATAIADAENLLKIEEEKKKLAEEIAKLEEESKMRSLSLAEQIYELEKKRLALNEGLQGKDEVEQLQDRKDALEIDKQIGELKKKQQDEAEKSAKEISDATAETSKRIAEAATREAEAQRNRAFESADNNGKAKILKQEQKDLQRQSYEAGKAGDYEAQIDKRAAAAAKGDELNDLLKTGLEGIAQPAIATSSLASIGAGGSANLLTSDTIEQRKISILQMIADNTARSDTGETKIPEPV
jgi:hypothetical protein